MPNEMEEARKWLESEQNRPEVEYLLHLLKQHQQLIERQMATTEQARRDRDALRECSRQLAEVQRELMVKKDEIESLMRQYRIVKNTLDDYGKQLTRALNMLAKVRGFCTEMRSYDSISLSS